MGRIGDEAAEFLTDIYHQGPGSETGQVAASALHGIGGPARRMRPASRALRPVGLPGFALYDVGIIVLSEPVPGAKVSEYVDLPSVGAVGHLGQKAVLDYIGFGVNQRFVGGGPPAWGGPRVRLAATGELIAPDRYAHSALVIKYSLNPALDKGGTCFGDSGGPDLVGGTDTVVAVNSYVTNTNCSGVGYSSRVDVATTLNWINSFLA